MADFGHYLYRVVVSSEGLYANFYNNRGAYETKNFKYEKAPFSFTVFERGVKLYISDIYFELPEEKVEVAEASYNVEANILTVNVRLTLPYTTYNIYCRYSGNALFIPYRPEIIGTL